MPTRPRLGANPIHEIGCKGGTSEQLPRPELTPDDLHERLLARMRRCRLHQVLHRVAVVGRGSHRARNEAQYFSTRWLWRRDAEPGSHGTSCAVVRVGARTAHAGRVGACSGERSERGCFLDEVIALARDRKQVDSRSFMLLALKRFKKSPQARHAIQDLATDPAFESEIGRYLLRRSAFLRAPTIEFLVLSRQHPSAPRSSAPACGHGWSRSYSGCTGTPKYRSETSEVIRRMSVHSSSVIASTSLANLAR